MNKKRKIRRSKRKYSRRPRIRGLRRTRKQKGSGFLGDTLTKTMRNLKSAIEVTAVGIIDTSNVKRLHFKNQFFVDYMDVASIRKLYGDETIQIRQNDRQDYIGSLGYLTKTSQTPGTPQTPETQEKTQADNEPENKDPVPDDSTIDKLWKIVNVPNSLSFNRLNQAEIIDPLFYENIMQGNDENQKNLMKSKCITFTRECQALFELQYTWKYLLHSLLWDMNDKSRATLRFIYTEMTKQIIQRPEYATFLRKSSTVVYLINFFARIGSSFKQSYDSVAEYAKKQIENVRKTPSALYASLFGSAAESTKSEGTTVQPQPPTNSPSPVAGQLQPTNPPSPMAEQPQPTNPPIDPSILDNSPVSIGQLLTQLRGYYNVPFWEGVDSHFNDNYIKYAIENKKFSELPPFYMLDDIKFVLNTTIKFLEKIASSSSNDDSLNKVVFVHNSMKCSVYNRLPFNKVYSLEIPTNIEYDKSKGQLFFFSELFEPDSSKDQPSTSPRPEGERQSVTDEDIITLLIKIQGYQTDINNKFVDFKANGKQYIREHPFLVSKDELDNLAQFALNRVNDATQNLVLGGGLTERMETYVNKKMSILKEKTNKAYQGVVKKNYFLDCVKVAFLHAARHRLRQYVIAPLFETPNQMSRTASPLRVEDLKNTLKMYKTLGLYSVRMANVVCQSPINKIIGQFDPSQSLLKTPHCFQLSFLTGMIINSFAKIQANNANVKDVIPDPMTKDTGDEKETDDEGKEK